jgi:hypothetical protein
MDDQPSVNGRPRIAVPVKDCVPSMPSVKCSTSTICGSRPGGRMAACPSARHLGHAHIPEIHGFTPARPRAFYETRCVCTRHTARAVNTGGSAARPSRRSRLDPWALRPRLAPGVLLTYRTVLTARNRKNSAGGSAGDASGARPDPSCCTNQRVAAAGAVSGMRFFASPGWGWCVPSIS